MKPCQRYKRVIRILENDVKGSYESGARDFAHFLIGKWGGVKKASDIPDLFIEFLNAKERVVKDEDSEGN